MKRELPFFSFARHGPVAGIDIGHREIKGVVIKKGRGGPELAGVARVDTPPGALESGEVGRIELLAGALGQVAEQLGIQGQRVVTAAPARHLIVRQMYLPPMPVEELAGAVHSEAETVLPVPLSELVLDYVTGGERPPEGPPEWEVTLLALPRTVAFSLAEAFAAAGIRLAAIDAEPLALYRAFGGQEWGQDSIMLVNGGASLITVAVFRCGRLLLARAVSTGTGVDPEAVATGGEWRNVAQEIGRSLDFYGQDVGRVYLTGGLAQRPGVSAMLAKELGLPVEVAIPQVAATAADPVLAVATGLALWEAPRGFKTARAANLLPEKLRDKSGDPQRVARQMVAAALPVLLAVTTLALAGQVQNWERRAGAVEAELALLEPQIAQVTAVMQEITTLQQRGEALQQLMPQDFSWYQFLQALAASLPPHTSLTGVITAENGRSVILQGVAPDLREVGLFVQAVTALPAVSATRLLGADQVDPRLHFSIEVQFDQKACPAEGDGQGSPGSEDDQVLPTGPGRGVGPAP